MVVIGVWQAWPADRDESLPSVAEQQQQLSGAPSPLATLHAQASELLEGDLRERLKTLRGHPVVINMWASWCGPCRAELPVLGRVALDTGKEVAFVGLNADDKNGRLAAQLLSDYPQSYPSYRDEDSEVARDLGFLSNFPSTLMLDRRGRTAFVHQGPYDDEETLRADIRRYLKVDP